MAILIPLLLAAVVGLAAYSLWKHLEFRKRLEGIPSPRSYPILGHSTIVKPDVQGFVDQIMGMANIYPENPRMVLFWAGPVPLLMIYSGELLKPIFTESVHFNKPFLYDMLVPWLGYGLLTSPLEKWRNRRKLLTPTFHYDILKNFVHVFNKQAEILVQQLKKVADKDEPVEISKYVTLCALDIICETSMGKCVDAQLKADSDYVKAVSTINDIIQNRQKNPLLWTDFTFWLLGQKKEHDWALNILHNFTKKVIAERKEEMKNEKNSECCERLAFLDLLLAMEEKGEITGQDLQQEVDTFMFEGHDTTASGINWALHLLGNHPEEQEKALAEIGEVIGDSPEVTFEHLGKLKYLECIIKESLRLQPSVPIFARVLGEDQELGGFNIPKGTQILVNSYLIHRDPSQWVDPDVFKPERFLPENSVGRHAFAFVPFSAGGRNCIGQRFALMEEKTVLTNILKNFKIVSTKRRDQLGFKTELILRPIDGVHVSLSSRI
uniref:Cytochrome P450 n=1 Tax=Panagrolaimus sp. JU765 TaxID=591449 RepID=A0AC34QNC6_9BILA